MLVTTTVQLLFWTYSSLQSESMVLLLVCEVIVAEKTLMLPLT
jgi:hypothetical protein